MEVHVSGVYWAMSCAFLLHTHFSRSVNDAHLRLASATSDYHSRAPSIDDAGSDLEGGQQLYRSSLWNFVTDQLLDNRTTSHVIDPDHLCHSHAGRYARSQTALQYFEPHSRNHSGEAYTAHRDRTNDQAVSDDWSNNGNKSNVVTNSEKVDDNSSIIEGTTDEGKRKTFLRNNNSLLRKLQSHPVYGQPGYLSCPMRKRVYESVEKAIERHRHHYVECDLNRIPYS
ncbi:hypothetical protein M422DRAFT_265570 [Sphaerobolus stellatus SS14]|uniref:Uncharacterized protein n=1 Tax=Sphaerobolus stellatus (strain SS14) TaxID=990650 RepID=A0A0C9V4Z2_SPHS4|nr:hypothetical protein M422DRAFT_265570 [Sphaerobolus stellatus SS14]